MIEWWEDGFSQRTLSRTHGCQGTARHGRFEDENFVCRFSGQFVGFGGDSAMRGLTTWVGVAQIHVDFAEFEESLSQQGGVGVAVWSVYEGVNRRDREASLP